MLRPQLRGACQVERGRGARISAPTLLLTGEDDAVNPPSVARTLADKIKGAVMRVGALRPLGDGGGPGRSQSQAPPIF